VYFTYFYRLRYLCAKNYQIWLRFDVVLTKQVGSCFGTHCSNIRNDRWIVLFQKVESQKVNTSWKLH